FSDRAPTETYTLSLHDALPIWGRASARPNLSASARGAGREAARRGAAAAARPRGGARGDGDRAGRDAAAGLGGPPGGAADAGGRSEEHTSELQSRENLVCRLLL